MLGIVKLAAIIAICYLSFTLVFLIIKPLSRRRKKNTRDFLHISKNQVHREKLYYFKDVLLRKFTSKVLLSELKREEFKSLITRLDLKITPETLRAQQIALAISAAILAIVIMQFSTFFGYLSFLGPILGWMYPVDEMERKLALRNKNIMLDFPAFYSMLYYQYSRSVDIYLADIVKDFLPNANPDMREELEALLDNIEYGEEFALKQFKKRVPLRYIVKFCDIMQTRLNGYDNVSQMAFLKNELHDLRVTSLDEDLKRRQNKNILAQFAIIIVLAIYVIIYFYFQFMEGLKMFTN